MWTDAISSEAESAFLATRVLFSINKIQKAELSQDWKKGLEEAKNFFQNAQHGRYLVQNWKIDGRAIETSHAYGKVLDVCDELKRTSPENYSKVNVDDLLHKYVDVLDKLMTNEGSNYGKLGTGVLIDFFKTLRKISLDKAAGPIEFVHVY